MTWEQENESQRKKEPQILRLTQTKISIDTKKPNSLNLKVENDFFL